MFFLSKLLKFGGGAAANKFKDSEKPFLDHLEDLRVTLMKVGITLVVTSMVAFIFYKGLIDIINYPVAQAFGTPDGKTDMIVLTPVEGFMSVLKICLYAALVCSFPLILYFIGEFIIPGLNEKEKKLIIPVVITSFLLFATGVLFAYFVVIPRALTFFKEFNDGVGIQTELRFKYTVSFVTMLSLVFGLCFELPVVVMSLVKLDLLNSRMMRNTRSYAIVAMFILAAVITPTPDIFTMSLLAGPMILLYEICIWMAWWMERKAAKLEAAEQEQERLALVESQKYAKQRAEAKEAEETQRAGAADTREKPTGATARAGTLEYDPDNEASFDDGDQSGGDQSAAEDQASAIVAPDANDDDGDDDDPPSGGAPAAPPAPPDIDPTSDAVWDQPAQAPSTASAESDSAYTPDDYAADHYDHSYHEDGYFSGSTEELKRVLHKELKQELTAELKQELKAEILAELRAELDKDATSGNDTESL